MFKLDRFLSVCFVFLCVSLSSLPILAAQQAQTGMSLEDYQAEAIAAMNDRQYDKAIPLLTFILSHDPQNETTYHLLSSIFIAQENFYQAILTLELAQANHVQSAELYQDLADTYLLMQLPRDSLGALKKIEGIANDHAA